jgi:uncharacterized protein
MGRLIFILLVVAALVWLLRRAVGGRSDRDAARSPELVRCARCGIYVPRGEATPASGGLLYCSDEHARLGPHSG